MADIRPVNDITYAQANNVNNIINADANSVNQRTNATVASTEYWYQQSKYYAEQSALSAAASENAKNLILSDAGFIAVSQDLTNINIVATNIDNVNIVATNIASVNAVADDLTNIGIIATDLSDENGILKSVEDNLTEITGVYNDLNNINAVYSDLSNIDTVVTNISDINTVATNISDVNTVAGDILKVNTVSDNISDIGDVADNISIITAVNSNSTNINAVADNETNINAVASNSTNINAVAGNATNINAVASNATNINAVNSNSTNINTVAGISSDVTTVANNASNIQTVVTNITDIQNAEENAALASQSATNAATSEDNAEIWAEGTDTQVSDLGGTHSAKGWADVVASSLSNYVPYSSATGTVDLNGQDLKNVDNLAVGTSTIDSNEKILSVGQNRFVTNNQNGLFISSTTSQTRKGMYGVPMALEIQFNSNNQAYSYPLGFHDMNANGNGGQFLFTSFSSAISAASAGDVMVENDKGGLIFNTGASKTGSKMRFTVGNWASTPQLTLTASSVGIKNLNPNSSYALDVTGTINASSDIKINGTSVLTGITNTMVVNALGYTPYDSNNPDGFTDNVGTVTSVNNNTPDSNGNVSLTIPTVNNATLTIQKNGTTVNTFSANASSDVTCNITVPTVDQTYDGTSTNAQSGVAVKSAIDSAVSSVYKPAGSVAFASLPALVSSLEGNVYNITDSFTTTADFVEGAGKTYPAGTNIVCIDTGSSVYKWDVLTGIVDLSGYQTLLNSTNKLNADYIQDGTTNKVVSATDVSNWNAKVDNTTTVNGYALSSDITLDASDVGALTSSDLADYVTLNTSQKIQAAKAIFGSDVAFGTDTTQKNLLAVISNSNSMAGNWIGRLAVGAKNKTFIMGTYGGICVLGAHSWTNAQQGTGAAWEDVYINPDGNKAVYIGGSPINGKQAILVIQNNNANTTGTVKINRSNNLTNNFKDVACWGDNVSKFNNDANYITSAALNGYATEQWVGNQGFLTSITSTDVTDALSYTPYDSTNPNNYVSATYDSTNEMLILG